VVVIKTFLAVFFGCVLAGVTLFFLYSGYEKFTIYLTEKEIEQKQQAVIDAKIQKKMTIKNAINSLINNCIQEASIFHSETAKLKRIARKGTDFVAVDYILVKSKAKHHALCYPESDSKVKFEFFE
jgi:hypothetical protein